MMFQGILSLTSAMSTTWESTQELQASELHLCAWEDHRTEPPGRDAKAHVRRGDDLGQAGWLHKGHIRPEQYGGFL